MIPNESENVNSQFCDEDPWAWVDANQEGLVDLSSLSSRFPPSQWTDLTQGSGLTPMTIHEAGIHTVFPYNIDRIVGPYIGKKIHGLMAFPYNHGSDFVRYKLFPAITDKRGHKIKYYQPEGSKPSLYLPPEVKGLDDTKTPLWIIEGEKKCLRWWQEGFRCCAGIAGAWNWKDGYSLIPKLIKDFNFPLSGRTVNIISDSDFYTNPGVKLGYLMFANTLLSRGADKVYLIIIPPAKDGKAGLDDFLQSDHHTVKDVLRLPKMRITLEVLRGYESEFSSLHFPNNELEDALKAIKNGWNPDKDPDGPELDESEVGRINPYTAIQSIWDKTPEEPHTCSIFHSKVHILSDGDSAWFADYPEDSWGCEICAWEKGKEGALKLATLFPDGFNYEMMPANADHNPLRKAINEAGGKGVKLFTRSGKKKAIVSDILADEKMRHLSWGDEEMKEFLITFLSYEPGWKAKTHKFDLFGEARKKPEKDKEGKKGKPLMRFIIKVKPGKDGKRLQGDELKEAVVKLRKQIIESFKRLGCEVGASSIKLSPLAKQFLRFVQGEWNSETPDFNFPDDDPLKDLRVYRPRGGPS